MNNLKKLISEDKIEECIEKLLVISIQSNQSIYNNCILLSSQYEQWKKEKLLNLEPLLSIRNKIELSLLQTIDELEKNSLNHIKIDYLKEFRAKKILENIKSNIDLLAAWEQKRDISNNPSERMFCEIEIEKFKNNITNYQIEYFNLV